MSQELLGLHNLQRDSKARKRSVRRGRGNASGRGNYSGRGMKGQKSRSGGKSGLKLRGVKTYLQRIPKQKGFKSKRLSNIPINLSVLDIYFSEGEVVSLKSLVKKNLIPKGSKNVKILGSGSINKKLNIRIDSLSVKAKEAIIKAGGEVVDTKDTKIDEKKKIEVTVKTSATKKEVKSESDLVKEEKVVNKKTVVKSKVKLAASLAADKTNPAKKLK